jgi:undecaprenyl-phosphate galactose phosphotransferase
MLLLPLSKRTLKKVLYAFDFFKNPILVLGDPKEIKILEEEFKKNFYLGQAVTDTKYHSVVIISKGIKKEILDHKIEDYLKQKVDLYIVPYLRDINFVHSNILEYYNIRTNAIHIENRLLIRRNIWIKQLFDMMLTLLVLPLFLIIHLILSLLIKLDSKGSIFFRQHRLGKENQDFLCYKYRTMHEQSDKLLQRYLEKNPNEVIHYKKYHKYQNDPRITKIGKILRATSLDELPQIINILKGEMSWVGPRPYMLNESDKLGDNLSFILRVKPGITGLWQVSGRNNLTFKERNELEVWYIKNWLLWDDFVILIKTIKVVFLKVGAK